MVTIGGIFIVSALISVLTTGLEARIAFGKGSSRLIERGHTVLLGWSEQVFTVIAELVEANQSARRSCVVILADRDKVDMEDQIRRGSATGNTRVVCRPGNPLKPGDSRPGEPGHRQVDHGVLAAGGDTDIDVIKTLLLLNARKWGARPTVVAAVAESGNLAAARLAAGAAALVIDADDIAVRLIVQSHRQCGLSTVFNELFGFDGNEIYLRTEPRLAAGPSARPWTRTSSAAHGLRARRGRSWSTRRWTPSSSAGTSW